jgi:hypothetical protein
MDPQPIDDSQIQNRLKNRVSLPPSKSATRQFLDSCATNTGTHRSKSSTSGAAIVAFDYRGGSSPRRLMSTLGEL